MSEEGWEVVQGKKSGQEGKAKSTRSATRSTTRSASALASKSAAASNAGGRSAPMEKRKTQSQPIPKKHLHGSTAASMSDQSPVAESKQPRDTSHSSPSAAKASATAPATQLAQEASAHPYPADSALEDVIQRVETIKLEPEPELEPVIPKPKAWSTGSRPVLLVDDQPGESATADTPQKPFLPPPAVDFKALCKDFLTKLNTVEPPNFVLRGLVNSGCACFRNCVLQVLAALQPLSAILAFLSDHLDVDRDLGSATQWRELLAFYQAFRTNSKAFEAQSFARQAMQADLYLHDTFAAFQLLVGPSSAATDTIPVVTESRRRSAGRSGPPKGSQQDAMEFLTYLLDELHEQAAWPPAEGATSAPTPTPSSLSVLQAETALGAEDSDGEGEATGPQGWHTVARRERRPVEVRGFRVETDAASLARNAQPSPCSPVAAVFHGCLRSEVLYRTRKACSVTFQRFHALTLHIPDPETLEPLPLEHALRAHFQLETIDDGATQKLVRLEILPRVLVLQIARFSFDFHRMAAVKVHRPVSYPARLALSPAFLSPRAAQAVGDRPPLYRLQGVVLHHGKKASGGHYSSFVAQYEAARGDAAAARWHHLNDSKHSVLTEAQALEAAELVYLLFYERIHT